MTCFTPSLITLGETMAMVAPSRAESLGTADELRLHVGGAESNVAAHAAALGIPTAWVGALGDDVLGHRVGAALAGHGVDTRWVSFDPDAPTGVYFKDPGRGVAYYRTGSAASRMGPGTVAGIPLESARVVHLSGITPALSASCAALVDTVAERLTGGGTMLSLDINYRPALWPRHLAAPALATRAARADLVLVGLDEAHALWGCTTPDQVRALLPGPARLVVKDAAVGATEYHHRQATFVPAIPVEVVEPVGAGDAFAGGYLAALLDGQDTPGALAAGHQRAALVLGCTGDYIARSARPA